MKTPRIFTVLALAVIFVFPAVAAERQHIPSVAKIDSEADNILKSLVRIKQQWIETQQIDVGHQMVPIDILVESSGSGTIISDTEVLTAWHVVDLAGKRTFIITEQGETINVLRVSRVGQRDVGIVHFPKGTFKNYPKVPVGDKEWWPEKMVPVSNFGYWGQGMKFGQASISTGILSPGVAPMWAEPREILDYWAVNTPIVEGMSGGPIIYKGKIIGVNSRGPASGYCWPAKVSNEILGITK